MVKKYEDYLNNLFSSEDIVFTSSELINKIREEFSDCTSENARKIIQNSVKREIIKSTKPVTFGHNQYAYYGVGCEPSIGKMINIIKETRPNLYRIIKRIYENGCVISYFDYLAP